MLRSFFPNIGNNVGLHSYIDNNALFLQKNSITYVRGRRRRGAGGGGGGPKYSFVQKKVLKWRYHNYSIKL